MSFAATPIRADAAPAVPFAGLAAGTDALISWAPAKVNLFLEIAGKRADGYHELQTLTVMVDLFDTLEVREDPVGKLELVCESPGVPEGPQNLAFAAAKRLQERFAPTRGARMRLTKRIPHQAGLGGGSSDAATALMALNRLWSTGCSPEDLAKLGAQLGSDVPGFFAAPACWCTGRGEVVEAEAVGQPLDLVVVKPPVGLATAAVYGRVRVPAAPVNGEAIRRSLRAGDPEGVARHLHNRLAEPAVEIRPEVGAVSRRLAAAGPLGVSMSGSGSAVFAVCRDRSDAVRVAGVYREEPVDSQDSVYVVRSYSPMAR
jgi:4-diphosphocytidyl-2-C-methyl-D-erythritol kinase